MLMQKVVCPVFLILSLAALGFAQGVATGDLHVTVKDT